MKQFLNEESIRNSEKKAVHSLRLLLAAAAAAGILLIVLCCLTRTGNARAMLTAAWISMLLLGWGMIALWLFRVAPARAEARHLRGLTEAETQTRTGRLYGTGDCFRIPGSVRVCKVRLETEEEALSLNLNEKLRGEMPPDGSLVRVTTARKFITGLETLEQGTGPARQERKQGGKKGRRAFALFFPPAFLWALMAVIFVGFIFSGITDTDPAHKITLYADCEVFRAPELAEKLEKEMDGSVRMVKVHPFSFAMFGTEALKTADLYIIPDSRVEQYAEWLAEEEGIPVYDPETGTNVAGEYFRYEAEGETAEIHRLYIGAGSPHLEDGLAERAADALIHLETQKEENP